MLTRLQALEDLVAKHALERTQWHRVEYNLIAHVLSLVRKNERDAELMGRAVLQGLDKQLTSGVEGFGIDPKDVQRALADVGARRIAGN